MTTRPYTWQHDILPPLAQQILRDAAATGQPETLARRQAVEDAIARVRRSFPQFFKPDHGSKFAEATK